MTPSDRSYLFSMCYWETCSSVTKLKFGFSSTWHCLRTCELLFCSYNNMAAFIWHLLFSTWHWATCSSLTEFKFDVSSTWYCHRSLDKVMHIAQAQTNIPKVWQIGASLQKTWEAMWTWKGTTILVFAINWFFDQSDKGDVILLTMWRQASSCYNMRPGFKLLNSDPWLQTATAAGNLPGAVAGMYESLAFG